jgi:hypothetical protein
MPQHTKIQTGSLKSALRSNQTAPVLAEALDRVMS